MNWFVYILVQIIIFRLILLIYLLILINLRLFYLYVCLNLSEFNYWCICSFNLAILIKFFCSLFNQILLVFILIREAEPWVGICSWIFQNSVLVCFLIKYFVNQTFSLYLNISGIMLLPTLSLHWFNSLQIEFSLQLVSFSSS